VEAGEKRKDAQLAREVEFSIPREMNEKQGVALARDFVKEQFVKRGMVADLNVHWDRPRMAVPSRTRMSCCRCARWARRVRPEGARLERTELLKHWREAWAATSTSGWPSWI
jgi:ATP-dependent exoDNAse (exonuclease V) alpha subunit